MKKITILSFLILLLAVSSIFAETEQQTTTTKKHQVGVRLGIWNNSGGTHPSSLVDISTGDSLTISIKDVNFYIEGYYAYNFYSSWFSEISFGMVNRGDMQYYSTSSLYDFSNILLFPILLQLKFYPLLSSNGKFQPFIGAGGGVYFAKQSLQFSNDYYAQYRNSDSETDFNYTLSGGFDWQLRSNFSIEVQTKYMPITFSNYFIGEKDYSATTITIGLKYKYNNKK